MSGSRAGGGATAAAAPVTSARVMAIAAPVALANATVPIQGAVDTAVIGGLGDAALLAAVGLAAQIFGVAFGVFNFLQIGASGLTAQALGRRDAPGVAETLLRGLGLATAIGVVLIALQAPLAWAALGLFEASPTAETATRIYFDWRILGAPAELANYALLGWFIGQEMTRRLFQHQVLLTASNVALNLWFALGLDWGIAGVALGTLLANLLALGYGLWLARAQIGRMLPVGWRPDRARLLDRTAFLRLMTLNRDIFIRTLLLMASFTWVARLGSLQGDVMLAANVVLLQFLMISSHALDGFAMAAETLTGQALGAGDARAFDRAAALSSAWAVGLAALGAAALTVAGPALIDLFTASPEVRAAARDHLLWASLIPLAGVAAFQLDGIFVGATAAREMRDAMIWTSIAFFPGSWIALEQFGNDGLWAALWAFLLLRAATLALYYPGIRARAAG